MSVRIDKYLWSVRLFKTRTIASDACKQGRVYVNDIVCKSSKNISGGEILRVKRGSQWHIYKIKNTLEKRVGAKLVGEYLEEIVEESC